MEESTYETAAERPEDDDFLSCTQRILNEKFASIIDAMAQKAVEGSLPHTKYLFEIGGVKEELLNQVQNNGEPTLADLLLAGVKKRPDAAPPTSVETVTEQSDCGVKGQ